VLTAARVPYAMARDGVLPQWLSWLGDVHPRFLTPLPSLVLQGVIAIALTWISTEPSWRDTYSRLFTYVVLSEFVFYALSCGAVIRLRSKAPQLERPYLAWGYPITPIVFIVFSLAFVAVTVVAQPWDALEGTLLILLGLPIYFLGRGRRALAG
jgi:APA family basic amino acid/polyamine antiporter